MSYKAQLLATMFPHLFLPEPTQARQHDEFRFKKITRYRIDGADVASAYYIGDASPQRKAVYYRLLESLKAAETITTEDVVSQWLYVSSGVSAPCASYILKLIALLDQERHEDIFPNLNLVLTTDTASADHPQTLMDSLHYLCRIHFSAEVYIMLSQDFKIMGIYEMNPAASTEHAFNVPKPFAPYATLFHSNNTTALLTVHYQSNGDVFLLGQEHYSAQKKYTVIASRRNRQWHCYDMDLLETLFRARFNNNQIGKSLLKIALELSYERHGGLIIYDQFRRLSHQQVLNPQSSDIHSSRDPFLKNFSTLIRSTPKKALSIAPGSMQILKNLMTLDGCVIFDDEGLQSVGSILSLQTHHTDPAVEEALQSAFSSILGGRNAASLYASALGGIALKISQNGTITFDTHYYKQTVTLKFL